MIGALEQIGFNRVLFSVDYPYEQMDIGGQWFDDLQLAEDVKLRVGRENANSLFRLGLPPLTRSAAAGFGS